MRPPTPPTIDTRCTRCLVGRRRAGTSLCLWCALEPEGRERARRAAAGARQDVGPFCARDDHERCTLGKTGCGCTCHDARTSRPGTDRRVHKADALYDALGRRVCACGEVLVKKNPHGPGRYPNACPSCKAARS